MHAHMSVAGVAVSGAQVNVVVMGRSSMTSTTMSKKTVPWWLLYLTSATRKANGPAPVPEAAQQPCLSVIAESFTFILRPSELEARDTSRQSNSTA